MIIPKATNTTEMINIGIIYNSDILPINDIKPPIKTLFIISCQTGFCAAGPSASNLRNIVTRNAAAKPTRQLTT